VSDGADSLIHLNLRGGVRPLRLCGTTKTMPFPRQVWNGFLLNSTTSY